MIITPSSVEARKKPSFKNRIFPENNILEENRPAHRTHPYGGTLVWGVANQPKIINPILTQSSVSATLMELIFNSLIRIDSKGNIIPGLAESWDISADGLAYTFHLKQGVQFHDGVELTAQDIKFTYEQINNPENNSPWRTNTELVDRWEIVDSHTLKMILKETFNPVLYKLVREIVPKHLWEGKNLYTAEFNHAPIGTGPFKFKDWNKETNQIELEANPRYFEGRPYLDKIVVKVYSDNSQLWAAVMRREVDLVQWITGKDYSIIESDPALKGYTHTATMYYAIAYNVKDSIWRDLELRKATAHGINIEEIIDTLPRFEGIKSTGPFHPESMGYNHEVKPIGYDPIKAKMMLMHRGWQDMSQDVYGAEPNIRKKHGRELEIRMLVDERNATYKRIAQVIRQQLAVIGVKVVILLYKDESELTEEYLEKYKPQAWLRLFSGLGLDPYEAISSWYSSSSEFGKLWDYKNDDLDQFFDLAGRTTDQRQRAEIYQKIHKIIYEDQPACFLFYPSWYLAVDAKFKNTNEYFSLYMLTYTIKDWYVSEELGGYPE